MRVGALITSYGTTDYLEPCIKQYKWVDRILVMNYLYPQSDPFPDNTPEICKKMDVECLSGVGKNQEVILNEGLDAFKDFDAVFTSDNDEFIMREDQDKLLKFFFYNHYDRVTALMIDYADDLYHKFQERSYDPVILCKPSVRFYDVRCADGLSGCKKDVKVHHFGFMFSKDKALWKSKKQKKTNGGQFDWLCTRPKFDTIPPQELVELLSDYCSLDKIQAVA